MFRLTRPAERYKCAVQVPTPHYTTLQIFVYQASNYANYNSLNLHMIDLNFYSAFTAV